MAGLTGSAGSAESARSAGPAGLAGFFKLARAVFSQDMNILAYKTHSKASGLKRAGFPLLIAAIIMVAMGCYAYGMTNVLSGMGVGYLVPVVTVVLFSVVSLIEGIYKAQGILFDSKDNNLLFSLPLRRSQIFAVRVVKLLVFQLLFNAIFMLPIFVVYAVVVQPAVSFYGVSALMLILTPLLPTAVAVVVGYLIKAFSVRMRFQKLGQVVLSFAALAIVMLALLNGQALLDGFAENAGSISDTISNIYYPVGAYTRLVQEFNTGDFVGLIAMCVLPLVVVIGLCSLNYFKVISKVNERNTHSRAVEVKAQRSSVMVALVKREVGRFFASPVLVVNTMVALVLLVIAVITASVSLESVAAVFGGEGEDGFDIGWIINALPAIYAGIMIFMITTSSITSSMISMEGKSFNITKSLPVSPMMILRSKVITSLVLSVPIVLVADVIFFIRFTPDLFNIILILLLTVLVPVFSAVVGLLMNLKYPKMNASSDTEVVKQSASSMIAVLIGMATGVVAIVAMILLGAVAGCPVLIAVVFFGLADAVVFRVLAGWGVKKFREISA